MCRLRTCCFCCSLRTGTYIAAIYTLVITVLAVITSVLALVNLGKVGDDLNKGLGTGDTGDTVQGDSGDKSVIGQIVYYVTVILYVLWFISAILVIVGIRKDRRGFLLPWIIITGIMVVIAAIALIMSCVEIKQVFEDGSRAVTFVIQCVMFGVSLYVWLVVFSFYRNNLKEADER